MDNGIRDKQHKRIIVLSSAAIVFGLNAVYHLAGAVFADQKSSLLNFEGNELFLLSACTLMICSVVTIAIRSHQDEKHARFLSRHDELTGLPSKQNLFHKLEKVVEHKRAKGALVLMNIRRLSKLNHSFGRAAGDRILEESAKRLQFLIEKPHFVGVVAPGVFAICLKDIENKSTIELLSEQLSEALSIPINVEGQNFYVECAISAALFSGDRLSASDIISNAELALLEARSKALRKPVIFSTSVQTTMEERGIMEAELRDALEKEALETYFQPLLSEDGKTLVGFEALARWDHPKHGMIPPSNFVPLASSLGLTDILGRQIMAKACQQIRPLDNLKISVNVTPEHFIQKDYVNQVRKLLEQTGVNPERLELEITETELLSESDMAKQRLAELRKLGVKVALDDFGTGYSGLSYINKFEVDRIKIDASFVQEIETSESARSMIRSICDIARQRRFAITAEGVETREQFEFLKQFPGLTYQGYLFGAPMHYREVLECKLLMDLNSRRFKEEFSSIDENAAHSSPMKNHAEAV